MIMNRNDIAHAVYTIGTVGCVVVYAMPVANTGSTGGVATPQPTATTTSACLTLCDASATCTAVVYKAATPSCYLITGTGTALAEVGSTLYTISSRQTTDCSTRMYFYYIDTTDAASELLLLLLMHG